MRAALGFERIVLVGHSWGSFLAPAYAAAHPGRVAALVPGSTLLPFQRLSHMAHIEDPARVVGATAAFLSRHA